MVEALRHAPRTTRVAPAAKLFIETCYEHLRIALDRVELVLKILDIGRTHAHTLYARGRRCNKRLSKRRRGLRWTPPSVTVGFPPMADLYDRDGRVGVLD